MQFVLAVSDGQAAITATRRGTPGGKDFNGETVDEPGQDRIRLPTVWALFQSRSTGVQGPPGPAGQVRRSEGTGDWL